MMELAIAEIPEVRCLGRTAWQEDGSLAVFWTASGIEMTVSATDLYLALDSFYRDLEIWIDVVIDGELSQRVQLRHGMNYVPVFQRMDPANPRTVRILRDTQAMAQDAVSVLKLNYIEADDGADFHAPKEEPELRLEIIGDSITSGEGAGLERQVEWVPAVFSAVNSYGYLTAEKLHARVNILSSSGWGLYASWDGQTKCALPPYYHEVCGLTETEEDRTYGSLEKWDFASYRPDCIVINLGTNDSGALQNTGKWPREEYHTLFNRAAVKFLHTLRSLNPESRLLWAYGMLGNDMADWIREAIDQYRGESGDDRVSYFEFANCGPDRLGARSHPNRTAHEEAAEALAAEIRRILR